MNLLGSKSKKPSEYLGFINDFQLKKIGESILSIDTNGRLKSAGSETLSLSKYLESANVGDTTLGFLKRDQSGFSLTDLSGDDVALTRRAGFTLGDDTLTTQQANDVNIGGATQNKQGKLGALGFLQSNLLTATQTTFSMSSGGYYAGGRVDSNSLLILDLDNKYNNLAAKSGSIAVTSSSGLTANSFWPWFGGSDPSGLTPNDNGSPATVIIPKNTVTVLDLNTPISAAYGFTNLATTNNHLVLPFTHSGEAGQTGTITIQQSNDNGVSYFDTRTIDLSTVDLTLDVNKPICFIVQRNLSTRTNLRISFNNLSFDYGFKGVYALATNRYRNFPTLIGETGGRIFGGLDFDNAVGFSNALRYRSASVLSWTLAKSGTNVFSLGRYNATGVQQTDVFTVNQDGSGVLNALSLNSISSQRPTGTTTHYSPVIEGYHLVDDNVNLMFSPRHHRNDNLLAYSTGKGHVITVSGTASGLSAAAIESAATPLVDAATVGNSSVQFTAGQTAVIDFSVSAQLISSPSDGYMSFSFSSTAVVAGSVLFETSTNNGTTYTSRGTVDLSTFVNTGVVKVASSFSFSTNLITNYRFTIANTGTVQFRLISVGLINPNSRSGQNLLGKRGGSLYGGLFIDGPTTADKFIGVRTLGVIRWQEGVAANSDMYGLFRYSDAGNNIGTSYTIDRLTGKGRANLISLEHVGSASQASTTGYFGDIGGYFIAGGRATNGGIRDIRFANIDNQLAYASRRNIVVTTSGTQPLTVANIHDVIDPIKDNHFTPGPQALTVNANQTSIIDFNVSAGLKTPARFTGGFMYMCVRASNNDLVGSISFEVSSDGGVSYTPRGTVDLSTFKNNLAALTVSSHLFSAASPLSTNFRFTITTSTSSLIIQDMGYCDPSSRILHNLVSRGGGNIYGGLEFSSQANASKLHSFKTLNTVRWQYGTNSTDEFVFNRHSSSGVLQSNPLRLESSGAVLTEALACNSFSSTRTPVHSPSSGRYHSTTWDNIFLFVNRLYTVTVTGLVQNIDGVFDGQTGKDYTSTPANTQIEITVDHAVNIYGNVYSSGDVVLNFYNTSFPSTSATVTVEEFNANTSTWFNMTEAHETNVAVNALALRHRVFKSTGQPFISTTRIRILDPVNPIAIASIEKYLTRGKNMCLNAVRLLNLTDTQTILVKDVTSSVKKHMSVIDPNASITAPFHRWAYGMNATTADYFLERFNDAGVSQGVNFRLERATGSAFFSNTLHAPTLLVNTTVNDATNKLQVVGNITTSTHYRVNNLQVVSSRKTGWGTPSGTLNRTAYTAYAGQSTNAFYSQAQAQTTDDAVKLLSQTVAALITDLHAGTSGHGLIAT